MLSLLELARQRKDFFMKPISNWHIRIFLIYSFGIETTNTFMHSRIPSKTIPEFRPKNYTAQLGERFLA